MAQNIDRAATGDLPLEPRQELAASGPIGGKGHCFKGFGLGGQQETAQLHQIDAVVAVVMGGISQQPTGATSHRHAGFGGHVGRHQHIGAAGHGPQDQRLQALFGGVGGHGGLAGKCPSNGQKPLLELP
ncbi:hypothetical protein [Synechococcus sp. CS-1326]|uniref:hypothetical protein n=1 Tax=Synechococcus sp. CS-1326 TaxID=2847978 RepID=UPI0037DA17CB